MAKKLPYKQKKSTAALVISIIELVAVLGTYLAFLLTAVIGVGSTGALGFPMLGDDALDNTFSDEYAEDYIEEDWESDWEENSDWVDYEGSGTVIPETTPEPVYCPHCGGELADEYVSYCDSCGLDPNAPAPTPVPEDLTAEQMSVEQMRMHVEEMGMMQLYADSTWESSIVDQKGTHNNTASALVDGDLDTSWQEGVDGDGLGESVMLDFGSEVEVQFIEMYLGNHRSDEWFYKNNVPQQVSIYCYGAEDGTFEVVPAYKDVHERGATCIQLSRPVPLRYLEFYIDSVYEGSQYDDTCIAEIKVYGYYK